jgi:NTE family protein
MSSSFVRAVFGAWMTAILAGLAAALPPLSAADDAHGRDAHRPRIGLVLAGGGARGIGHVGVIQLLEELNIQVDCVAGTSMGSIVGGLYAAGYTSEEMRAWLQECDWERMLSDSLPRQDRGFRAKAEEMDTPRWIELGIGAGGIKVPNAFVSGQNLLVALREKTDFVGTLTSFDTLPVPYRAVATDVETGAMVVLDHGTLADAMRASMAVPGAFAPHTLDGRVLIDGFASRNLPVSVVRDMGVDVIIAVDVRADLQKADELNSPMAMAAQLLAILSARDTVDQIATLGERDVLVRLKLAGYSAGSFRDAVDIARIGYDEAQAFRDALAPLALPAEVYAAREQTRRALRRDLPVIAAVEVRGQGGVAESAVRRRLGVTVGQPLDPEELRTGLGRVHDLGHFKSVDYRIEDRPEGKVLVVSLEPKPWGPNLAILGFGIESDLDGETEMNFRASMRFTQINRMGAELALKISAGTIDRLDAEFFQPVGADGLFFVAPHAELKRTPEAYTADLGQFIPGARPLRLTFQRQTAFAGLAGGARFGSYGELRVGAERGSVDYSKIRSPSIIVIGPDGEIQVIDLAEDLEGYTTDRFYGNLILDRLDDAFFPRRGYYLFAGAEHETGENGATTGSLRLTGPVTLGSVVIQPSLSIDHMFDEPENSARLPFRVGGLFNLSGVPTDEVYGANTAVGVLIVRKRLGGPGGPKGLYVGGSLEAGNAWDDDGRWVPEDWIWAGSAFVATSTPIGPLHLAVGLASDRDPVVYFYLGRVIP